MPGQDDNQVLPPAPDTNDNAQMELPSPAMDNVQELNSEPEQEEESFPDFYKTLGVDRDASPREIKQAYAKELEKLNEALANKTIDVTAANRVRPQLQRAYETLSDPFARKTYDVALEQMTKDKKGPVTELWDSKYKDKFKDAFFGANASLMKCIILLIQFLVEVVKLKQDESLEKRVSSLNEELDERLKTLTEQELPSPTMSHPQELPSVDGPAAVQQQDQHAAQEEPAAVRQARATMTQDERAAGKTAGQVAREALASHETVAQHHADPAAVAGQRGGARMMTNPVPSVSFPNVKPDGQVVPPPKPQGPAAAQPDPDQGLKK